MKSFELTRLRVFYCFLCVSFSIFNPTFGQLFSVDTDSLDPLLYEWNFGHQQKSIESLDRVYGDSVYYFGSHYSKKSLLRLKRQLFATQPEFTQTIKEISFIPYSSGVVKAEFTREIRNGGNLSGVRKTRLIFSYDNHKYRIVGESDSLSDVQSGFEDTLGEPLNLSDSVRDSSTNIASETVYKPRNVLENLGASVLLSDEVIELPLRYLVVISSVLLITFIFLIVSIARLKKAGTNGNRSAVKTNGSLTKAGRHAFLRFVVTLFDPLYFTLITSNHASSHNYKGIDLEFQFRKNDVKAYVGLKCIYLTEKVNGNIQLLSNSAMQELQGLEQSWGEMEFYIILGIGGRPDDPAETYSIPVHEINSENISYGQLQQYRKYGMFFYNSNAGQLK